MSTSQREHVHGPPLGAELPAGARFVGPEGGAPRWRLEDAPADEDLNACVACGLCLPHCPTYRVTGEESASPRGRIAAMRSVSEGRADVDGVFASFMDLCLACRACEDVCPSHVPFGRMIERARVQIEPLRSPSARAGRWLGLDVVLPRPRLLSIATTLAPLARRLLPSRLRSLLAGVPPRPRGARLPERTDPPADVAPRGTVVLLRGCVQDRWFREVNLASIRVLARNGWRVVVPPDQACCGALPAHHGRLRTARRLAARNLLALDGDARIVVNAAGCSAHMKEYGDLLPDDERAARTAARVLDLMEFLHDTGVVPPEHGAGVDRVAVHDPCHALRAQRIHEQPRAVLAGIPGVEILEIPNGDRCCGAAGLYNLLQPEMADELMRQKADGIERTGARVVASANPGCTMQISAGLRARGRNVEVLHPVELLARAYAGADPP